MTDAILPPALKPGDTIGVMAPSSHVERTDIDAAAKILEKKGYKVFVHPQTFERHNQSAGLALQKTLALQGLWQRPDIKAIWCAGGGNRALHFMDSINFEAMKRKPRILVGFSDVTALLNGIYANTGIVTVHGPVFKNLPKYREWDALAALLSGKKTECPLGKAKVLRPGKVKGRLVGGNLSLFQYLPQTLPGEFYKDAILFLEDCNEELSRIDRMLLHLRRLGVLKKISGLVLGEFTDMKESGRLYGFSLADIVSEHTEGLDIPIVLSAPFGHGRKLWPLAVGAQATLDTAKAVLRVDKATAA